MSARVYVNVYLGQTRAAGWIQLLASYGFGEMVCRGELPARRHTYAFDNGAFKDWTAGKPFDTARYLVVQDGMEAGHVERELEPFAGIFVGGSLGWKLRTAPQWIALAHAHNLKCHVGRMGTTKRVRAALRWGADSIDSALPLWSAENLASFLRGFNPTGQTEFQIPGVA